MSNNEYMPAETPREHAERRLDHLKGIINTAKETIYEEEVSRRHSWYGAYKIVAESLIEEFVSIKEELEKEGMLTVQEIAIAQTRLDSLRQKMDEVYKIHEEKGHPVYEPVRHSLLRQLDVFRIKKI